MGDLSPKKMVKNILEITLNGSEKTVPTTFQAPQLVLIIGHLQRHPSLHLPISIMFNIFSKYFKLWLFFKAVSNNLNLNLFK